MAKEKSQIKSKQRVQERGEVFTNEREVKAMCDLVKDETERIESRFLEPACGDGNFLAEIVTRKLAVVSKIYGKSETDWEKYSEVGKGVISAFHIAADKRPFRKNNWVAIVIKHRECVAAKHVAR